MKITLLSSLLLLPASLCLADVAIYHGAQVVKTTSLPDTSTKVEKFVEVIDLANSKLVIITLHESKGKKTFVVGTPEPVVITAVQDSHGRNRSSTVLAEASTSTDTSSGVITVSSFLQQGNDGQAILKGTDTTAIPRNLQGSASLVSTAGSSTSTSTPPVVTPILPALVETKSVATLAVDASQASNNAGDTSLVPVVQRVKADLIARGFVDGSVQPQ